MADSAAQRLLVNFVYAQPVGHAIEALHACHGYHRADQSLRIAVALNAAAPTELAALCPFIEATYAVPLDITDPDAPVRELLAGIPPAWDWVVVDDRGRQPEQRALFPGAGAYYDAAADRFTSALHIGAAGASPPAYARGEPFRLSLPDDARRRAEERLGPARPRIAVLPGGSGPRECYPSTASWELVLRALADQFPGAVFCFLGKLAADGRTRTTYDRAEFDRIAGAVARSVAAVDLPIVDQLATVAGCDVFVSPHSGFGMAALAVGTPWLSLAGNKWPEYYFNGVPFYSVLPDPDRFPCYAGLDADPPLVDDDGPRTPSMCGERIREDLEELLDGAARLVERRWPYETALADHARRVYRFHRGDTSRIWSWDDVLRPYVEAEAARF